jgi:hypothetical protein
MVKILQDGANVIITAIIFIILDTIVLSLRFYSKHRTKIGFAIDDLLIGFGYVLFLAMAAVEIHGMYGSIWAKIHTKTFLFPSNSKCIGNFRAYVDAKYASIQNYPEGKPLYQQLN